MPFNLLLFPLVGGYYFLTTFNHYKFLHQRLERQRLLFNSVIAGSILLLFSFFITWAFTSLLPEFSETFKHNLPIDLPFFGTTVCSFLLGILSAHVGNLFIDEGKSISRAIKKIGNELELLLEDSIKNEFLIQVTLKNDKFYIGWVKALPIPQHSSYIVLLPAFSGYRDGNTKEMIFTTQYLDVYATYVEQGQVTDVSKLTRLVLKADDILSANEFDIDMYERFNNTEVRRTSSTEAVKEEYSS